MFLTSNLSDCLLNLFLLSFVFMVEPRGIQLCVTDFITCTKLLVLFLLYHRVCIFLIFPFTALCLLHYSLLSCNCRTPEWLKKMFAAVTKSERNGPVFRFFMDLGDAGTG